MTEGPADSDRPTCIVAGASTAVGRLLPQHLDDRFRVVGLADDSTGGEIPEYGALDLRTYNPFSLEETLVALEDADRIVYIASRPRPHGRWVQSSRRSLDLLCAANVAAAADEISADRAVMLASSLEVAATDPARDLPELADPFGAAETPSAAITAHALIGRRTRLTGVVRSLASQPRLPRCPAWTRRQRPVVAVDDAAKVVARCVAEDAEFDGRSTLEPPERTSFRELLVRALDDPERAASLRDLTGDWPRLSAWRLARLCGSDRDLMHSVVESFRTETPTSRGDTERRDVPTRANEALAAALEAEETPATTRSGTDALQAATPKRSGAYSLQRLPNPSGMASDELAREYFRWLQRTLRWILRIEEHGDRVEMYARGTQIPLLVLAEMHPTGAGDRTTFRVAGGRLAADDGDAYFEFRPLPHAGELLVALRNYRTVLPWLLYRWTQAVIHGWAMRGFGRHLAGLGAAS